MKGGGCLPLAGSHAIIELASSGGPGQALAVEALPAGEAEARQELNVEALQRRQGPRRGGECEAGRDEPAHAPAVAPFATLALASTAAVATITAAAAAATGPRAVGWEGGAVRDAAEGAGELAGVDGA